MGVVSGDVGAAFDGTPRPDPTYSLLSLLSGDESISGSTASSSSVSLSRSP